MFINIKSELLEKLNISVSHLSGLLSFTLIGSHANLEKQLERDNDFDLVFIFEKFDANKFQEVVNLFDKFSHDNSNPELRIWTEYRIGPVKARHDGQEKYGIMLHLLLFDLKSFTEYQTVGPFGTFSWSKFKPLMGDSLSNLFKFDFPNKEQLLSAPRHSVDFYEKMLNEKIYILKDVKAENNSINYITHTYSYPREQWPELFSDVIQKVILDAIIVYRQINVELNNKKLLEIFFETFPDLKNKENQVSEIISLKKRLREGENFSESIENYDKKTKELLLQIRKAIEEKAV